MASEPKVLFTRDEISEAIDRIAAEIRRDYRGKKPLLLGILKGSAVFLSDLIRRLDMPVEIEFIRMSSYGSGTVTSGKVTMVQGLKTQIKDRHVLVVEDIVDTGLTLSHLMNYLRKKKPASLKLCALTDKPSRRKVPVEINYLGFEVPDKFIVGYGIDLNEQFRYLPDIRYFD